MLSIRTGKGQTGNKGQIQDDAFFVGFQGDLLLSICPHHLSNLLSRYFDLKVNCILLKF